MGMTGLEWNDQGGRRSIATGRTKSDVYSVGAKLQSSQWILVFGEAYLLLRHTLFILTGSKRRMK